VVDILRVADCQLSVDRIFLGQDRQYGLEAFCCLENQHERNEEGGRPFGRKRLKALGFLDSNVLANWVFIDASLRTARVDRDSLFQTLARYVPSYLLLERLKTDTHIRGFLTTSQLAYAEILSVLVDQFVEEKMHAQGIMARLFERERHSIELTPEDVGDVVKQLAHLTDEFFKAPHEYVRFVGDEYDFREFAKLRTVVRAETYDAILIATASYQKCDYFVTEDGRLRETIKNASWVPMDIQVASVQEYVSIIQQSKKHLATKN
jgi:predicted nucleic acid-binding protein